MDDLIGRQAAIMDAESWVAVDEYEKHLQKSVIEWLKEFPPSAQPFTVIRCKDCKWKYGAECVRFADVRPFPDDFCSRAERRDE